MHEQYYNIFDSKRRNKIICCFVERINLVALSMLLQEQELVCNSAVLFSVLRDHFLWNDFNSILQSKSPATGDMKRINCCVLIQWNKPFKMTKFIIKIQFVIVLNKTRCMNAFRLSINYFLFIIMDSFWDAFAVTILPTIYQRFDLFFLWFHLLFL